MSVYIIVYDLHVQFSLGNLMFFITKHHINATKCFIVTQGGVPNVPSGMFHEAPNVQSGGAWCDVFNQALMFPNAKDDLPQLFLKDMKV
jgi:hypothetical protein